MPVNQNASDKPRESATEGDSPCSCWHNGETGYFEYCAEHMPDSLSIPPSPIAEALRNLVRVIERDDVPGYIYDATEAECGGCEATAPTIAEIVHGADCFQGALEAARDAIGVAQLPRKSGANSPLREHSKGVEEKGGQS